MVKQGQQGVLWEMCKWRIRERIAAKAHKVEEGLSSSKWNIFYFYREQSRGNTEVNFWTISIIFVRCHVVSKEPMRERDFGEKNQSYHNDFHRFLPKYKKDEHTGRN